MTLQHGAARRSRGLSMVEVMAAMVIFSTGAVVLFSWISQTATRLSTLRSEQDRLFGELAALDFARSLNPMLQGSGQVELDGATARWSAQAVGAESQVRNATGAPGLYVVRLYQVRLVVEQTRASPSELTIYLPGWRQVREASTNTPFVFDAK